MLFFTIFFFLHLFAALIRALSVFERNCSEKKKQSKKKQRACQKNNAKMYYFLLVVFVVFDLLFHVSHWWINSSISMWEMAKWHSPRFHCCCSCCYLCFRKKVEKWNWETLYFVYSTHVNLFAERIFSVYFVFCKRTRALARPNEIKIDFAFWFVSSLIKKKVYLFLAFKIGNRTDELLTHQPSTISHTTQGNNVYCGAASLEIERELKMQPLRWTQFRRRRHRRRRRQSRLTDETKKINLFSDARVRANTHSSYPWRVSSCFEHES